MLTYAEKKWGNCSKAVAYELNFVQMCYSSESRCWSDFYDILCDDCYKTIQNKDLIYPKGSFSKKDYYILDLYCYGVSAKLKEDMILYGVSKKVFRPIYASRGNLVLGYQIKPLNILPPIYKENGMIEASCCKKCGRIEYEIKDDLYSTDAYDGLGYPTYITQEALDRVQDVNGLYEDNDDVIISTDLYNYLIKKYPRLECRPVFLGSVYDDAEYIRLHKN